MRRDGWGKRIDFLVDLVRAGGGGGGRHCRERNERRLRREGEQGRAREKVRDLFVVCGRNWHAAGDVFGVRSVEEL